MGEERKVYGVLVREPEGKRPLGRPRHRWEGIEWIQLAQNSGRWRALVNPVMSLWVLAPRI
jgi:hypothetical protein